jgi:hypothetical protein
MTGRDLLPEVLRRHQFTGLVPYRFASIPFHVDVKRPSRRQTTSRVPLKCSNPLWDLGLARDLT